ncbi:MAG TPA: 6-phosphogluconolactonase [Gammaproteobacteria bacterium]|nr:6-phosphogluconolactonase [Gammaproteobacteria bacterium]
MPLPTPEIYENSLSLHRAAADYFLKVYQAAVTSQDMFHVALSGGTTPKHLYKLLAQSEYAEQIDWSKVSVYFGDERFVPHTHNDSNFKMASQALLQHVAIPETNIHKVATNLATAQLAAEDYEMQLMQHLPKNDFNKIQFDLILLGLGPDGHTASLFPDTNILQQQTKYCDAVFVKKFNSWRISITFPVINQAKHILLLSEGAAKSDIVYALSQTNAENLIYPVQMIKPQNTMHWYIDKSAAARLISP